MKAIAPTDASNTALRIAESAGALGLSQVQLEGLVASLKGGPLHLVEGHMKAVLHEAAEILAQNAAQAKDNPKALTEAQLSSDFHAAMGSATPSPTALEELATRAEALLKQDPTAARAALILGIITQSQAAFATAMRLDARLLDRGVFRFAVSNSPHYPLPNYAGPFDLFAAANKAMMTGYHPALLKAYREVAMKEWQAPMQRLAAPLAEALSALGPERKAYALYSAALVEVLQQPSYIGNMDFHYTMNGPREFFGSGARYVTAELERAAGADPTARANAVEKAEKHAYELLHAASRYLHSTTAPAYSYQPLVDRRRSVFTPMLTGASEEVNARLAQG